MSEMSEMSTVPENDSVVCTDIDSLPMDERRRWQLKVRMVIRRDFRNLFGSVFADGCGFFVDRHLSHAVHAFMDWIEYPKEHAVLKEHPGFAYSCAISNDGYHLFVGYYDHSTIGVWNLLNRTMVKEWNAKGMVCFMDCHCEFLVTGGSDGKIALWNAYTYQLIHNLIGHTRSVLCTRFSDDGTHIVSCSDDCTIRMWSSNTGECARVLKGHRDVILDVLFIHNCIVSTSDDGTIRVWDSKDGSELKSIRAPTVCTLSINCDQSMLAAIEDDGCVFFKWPEMELISDLPIGNPQTGMFHPLYPSIMAIDNSDEHCTEIWDVSAKKCLRSLDLHSKSTYDLCFSPDGCLLTCLEDDGSVHVFDLR